MHIIYDVLFTLPQYIYIIHLPMNYVNCFWGRNLLFLLFGCLFRPLGFPIANFLAGQYACGCNSDVNTEI